MRVLAVDGGASSTRALVGSASGQVLAVGHAGPSNHLQGEAGKRRLRRALADSYEDAVSRLGEPEHQFAAGWLGMTGYREGTQEWEIIESALAGIATCDRVSVSGDMVTAHAGASVAKDGILVYAGTGSNSLAIDKNGREVRVGGWGYMVDDEGGGYQIGRSALKAVYRAEDRRGPGTTLTGRVLEYFEAKSLSDLMRVVYKDDGIGRPEVARLTQIVAEAANHDGDEVASRILADAGVELGIMAIAAHGRLPSLGMSPPVYAAGGVFASGTQVNDAFRRTILGRLPGADFRSPTFSPVVGAYLLALRSLGVELTDQLLASVKSTWAAVAGSKTR